MDLTDVSLRPATTADSDFVYSVTEICMREYAERTWGIWREDARRAEFEPATHEIIQSRGADIGCIALREEPAALVVDKFYIVPGQQNRGIGSFLLQQLIAHARDKGKPIRLSVLKVNPARRFYERHGFVVSATTEQGHLMEWQPKRGA